MAWFKYLKNTYNIDSSTPTAEYGSAPLRRRVLLDNLQENIEENEVIYVDLGEKLISSYISTDLSTASNDDSYIVVYEDEESDAYATPVKSKVLNNIIYFKAAEKHNKNADTSRYYSVYYGNNGIKYLEEYLTLDDQVVFKQIDDFDLLIYEDGIFLDLAAEEAETYSYSAEIDSSSKSYKLALYNNGIDWKDNTSTNSGSKAFGVFDGPGFQINGSVGPDFGKFKIRILSFYEDNSISRNIALDWTEIDCYNASAINDTIIYSNSSLEYQKYIFELEVLTDKNIMSTSNSIRIDKYMFSPNYKLTYEKEEFNPDLAFIKIGGIR
jgi:hypothetical protein